MLHTFKRNISFISLTILLLISLSCNRIEGTSLLGLKLGGHYSTDDIISAVGAEGDYIDITKGVQRTNINYEDLRFEGRTWDLAGFSIAGGKNTFWKLCLGKFYDDKRAGRDDLYSVKENLERKFKLSSTKREESNEFFLFEDSDDYTKGGEVVLTYQDLGRYYRLMVQYRLKSLQFIMDQQQRRAIKNLQEGAYGKEQENVDVDATIERINEESW